ncbi:type I restriction enzyme HsdR N-terminal domain-containing protein [Shivajiella indica]|uniref:Type I restriction enzyme HsdR N-terminal domain-containing protein n=1 Tax=Shivajiella indica TaxID=872115 RepID=A0ABW5B8K3_9BACT
MTANRYAFLQEKLNFPELNFKIVEEEGKLSIFDSLRKKYLILTPEEWVRQHMIAFLIQFRDYPKSLFSLEKGVQYNQLQKRFDILIRNRKGNPFLLMECKAPNVLLSQKTVEQICVYNKSLNAQFLGITNGIKHLFLAFDKKTGNYVQIADIPKFNCINK